MCTYEIKSERRADVTILSIDGELDLSVAVEVEGLIADAMSVGPTIVDLSHCTYLDSSILTVFVRLTARSEERFSLVVPSGSKVQRIFEVTQLLRTLPIFGDRVAAVRYPTLIDQMNATGAQIVARSHDAYESALGGGAHDMRTA